MTVPDKPLTDAQRRALQILIDYPGITPGLFAQHMWPDSPAWGRVSHVGNGSATGVGITRAGGGFLGKLAKAGLTRSHWRETYAEHYITPSGRKALKEAQSSR